MDKQTRLIIAGGFLGAGKTTLIDHTYMGCGTETYGKRLASRIDYK